MTLSWDGRGQAGRDRFEGRGRGGLDGHGLAGGQGEFEGQGVEHEPGEASWRAGSP